MPTVSRRPGRALAIAAALVLAACSDSTGPQAHLSDPQGLSTDLQAITAVLQSGTFQSFSALTYASGSPVAAPTPAGTLLHSAPITPPRSVAAPYANGRMQAQALRRLATSLRSGISASVVPPALLGHTFTWDVTTHAYIDDASYTPVAPSDRARIIIYAVDPLTGDIVESPLTPVGYVDLIDESTTSPAVDKLHVIVTGGTPASPGTVYVDYTVSAQATGNPVTAFTASASGSVTDGTNTLTFSATYAVTQVDTDNPDVAVDVTWSLSDPAIQVELHETLTLGDADHLTLEIAEFSIQRGNESVSMHGTITSVLSTGAFTINLTIDVNGVPWVRITGSDAGVRIRHADGSQLSAAEAQAFLDLFNLWGSSDFSMLSVFGPPGTLMGA